GQGYRADGDREYGRHRSVAPSRTAAERPDRSPGAAPADGRPPGGLHRRRRPSPIPDRLHPPHQATTGSAQPGNGPALGRDSGGTRQDALRKDRGTPTSAGAEHVQQGHLLPAGHEEPVMMLDGDPGGRVPAPVRAARDRKSTRLNSSHVKISYAVSCSKKKRIRDGDLLT